VHFGILLPCPCSEIPLYLPVILERKKQIVRLKVKSDGTVFDANVQLYILDL
ncbi:Uncharacterized protein DAT39_010820, partial [Clarias magur]